MSAPRVSVLMPAFNAERTLKASVESVLAQTVGDLELLVVDDASDAPAADVLAGVGDSRLRVVRRSRNGGTGRARNSGIRQALAPLLSQLDADDTWAPEYLAHVLPRFADPRIGLVYTNAYIVGHPEGVDDYIGDPSIHPRDDFPELAQSNPIPCPTVTMRAVAVRGVGCYSRWLRSAEDWNLYLRLAAAGWRFDYVDRRLAHYRWPQSWRGKSHDPRRLERWVRLGLADAAVRRPWTPALGRALVCRLAQAPEHGAR